MKETAKAQLHLLTWKL